MKFLQIAVLVGFASGQASAATPQDPLSADYSNLSAQTQEAVKEAESQKDRFVPLDELETPVAIPLSTEDWDELMKKLMAATPKTEKIAFSPESEKRFKDDPSGWPNSNIPDTKETYTLTNNTPFSTPYWKQKCPAGMTPENTLTTWISYMRDSRKEISSVVDLEVECVKRSRFRGRLLDRGDRLYVRMYRDKRVVESVQIWTTSVFQSSTIVVWEKDGKVQRGNGDLERFLHVLHLALSSFLKN